MDGLVVDGRRYSVSRPSQNGESTPALITEVWTARDLLISVLSKMDDPGRGQFTSQIQAGTIQRSEPDPSLFQIPAGYKIIDIPQP